MADTTTPRNMARAELTTEGREPRPSTRHWIQDATAFDVCYRALLLDGAPRPEFDPECAGSVVDAMCEHEGRDRGELWRVLGDNVRGRLTHLIRRARYGA